MKKIIGKILVNGVDLLFDGTTRNGRTSPLAICPVCGLSRRTTHSFYIQLRHGNTTGQCHKCAGLTQSTLRKGKPKLVTDEKLKTGSIIHWGERTTLSRVPVTCGLCHEKRVVTFLRNPDWTGYCRNHGPSGKGHHKWKGGRTTADGYVYIHISTLNKEDAILATPMLTRACYVLEHRLVMARRIGRPLLKDEIVHHLNGIKSENTDSNLEIVSASSHPTENKATTDRLRDEIDRLQNLLKSNRIAY